SVRCYEEGSAEWHVGELEKEPYDSEEEAGSAIDVGRDEEPSSVKDDDEWEADSMEEKEKEDI
ncbi:hypothetical protein BGZ92_005537, partial [Podila epicladia]